MFYRLTLMALGLVASCSHPKQPSEAMKETVSTCETANGPSSMMACGDRPGEEPSLICSATLSNDRFRMGVVGQN